MTNITQKLVILLFFLILNGCISVSDIIENDETAVEPIDEVGQLLSDIQEEEANLTLIEPNEKPSLEISDEKGDESIKDDSEEIAEQVVDQ